MKKRPKNLENIILVLAMVVLGAALFGCSATQNADNRKRGEIPMPDEIIEAGDLIKNIESPYGGDREVEKYSEKFIAIRGSGSVITTPKGDDGFGSFSFKAEGRKITSIVCWFTKADAEQFSKIKADQYVTVKGRFTLSTDFIELRPCQVVKIE